MASEDLELSNTNIDKLANAISQGIAATAPKKVSLGQFLRRNPVPKLKYVCYQNGYRIPDKRIPLTSVEYLNRITRPGRYINRIVEVALWEEGGNVNLDLRYTNNTPDSRFDNKDHFRNFTELVQKIVTEQDVILEKVKRNERAVAKILAQNDAEDAADVAEAEAAEKASEPRIESVAQTPRQEATGKQIRQRTSFASAATRKARAEAGV